MKLLIKILSLLLVSTVIIFSFTSCKNVGGAGLEKDTEFASAFRSLKIGSIVTANNRVAVTTAIDTREVITIFTPQPSTPSLTDVLFRTVSDEAILISLNNNGLPVRAISDNLVVEFLNYTSSTVDVRITSGNTVFPLTTTSLSQDVREIIQKVQPLKVFQASKQLQKQIKQGGNTVVLEESFYRNVFLVGILTSKIYGCNARSALSNNPGQGGEEFLSFFNSVCGSLLLTTMNNVSIIDTLTNRVLDDFIGDAITCAFSAGDFSGAKDCLRNVTEEIIREVLISAPNLEIVINGTFDPETGDVIPPPPPPPANQGNNNQPPKQPVEEPVVVQPENPEPVTPEEPEAPEPVTPEEPEAPQEPEPNDPVTFFGEYFGILFDQTDMQLDVNCPGEIEFLVSVIDQGDNSCTNPNCSFVGSAFFSYGFGDITFLSSVSGNVDNNGMGTGSTNVSDPNVPNEDFNFTISIMESTETLIFIDYESTEQNCVGSGVLVEAEAI